ncbi:MAG: hypothetical protein P3B76_01470 [Gemmatimonadota bacterium]|jgi:hypothetical protein|nr:hypothetical protein [Gemmatimonadota bacterium]MDQ8167254.1 hypothetical protein [Gemmatimonadota bacterium]MDQ8171331.1 hypothetical protein [Gemmatimonadota bacterium]
MSAVRDGVGVLLGASGLTVLTYALALRLRNWAVWLAAFAITLCTLVGWWTQRGSVGAAT